MVGWSKLVVLVAVGVVACGSPADKKASGDSFCAAADRLFNKGSFASDGGGVVDSLRTLDLAALTNVDRESMTHAIDAVEANIKAFQTDAPLDSWSTAPVADVAARICRRDMQRFLVMP